MRRRPWLAQIGDRVRTIRMRRGLTQQELAAMMDMHQPSISALECGRLGMSVPTIIKLARILQVTTDAILTGEKNEKA